MVHRAIVRAGLVGVIVASVPLARSRYLRWGARNDEIAATLAGDELLPDPDLVATRAISIAAGVDRVWPWLAQFGQGRGGLYSYDALENLVARCDMHSADRIVPEWQHIAVGDAVRLHPEVALTVAVVEPESALVLRGAVPTGGAPAPYDFTWAFVLHDRPDGTARLVVRERYAYVRPWARLLVEPVEAVSFVMSQKMLRGIRDRAERRVG